MIHVVINNGAHETIGGMPTVGSDIDIVVVAKGCGFPCAVSVSSFAELDRELEKAKDVRVQSVQGKISEDLLRQRWIIRECLWSIWKDCRNLLNHSI